MAKTRFSISIDEDAAARIREAAARANEDVSTYIGAAALEAVDRDHHVAMVFADIDADIDATEQAGDATSPPAGPGTDELSPAEHAAIAARWNAFFHVADAA